MKKSQKAKVKSKKISDTVPAEQAKSLTVAKRKPLPRKSPIKIQNLRLGIFPF
jgi:hypothetical protein